jgi:hypothetical protein
MSEQATKQDIEMEKKDALETMGGFGLIDILESENDETMLLVDDVNDVLIDLIIDFPDFKTDLERALYHNQEKLTHKKFLMDGSPATPSVSNWLKHFIKLQGTSIFSNLDISSYFIKTQNTQSLDELEKRLLGKLLILFRNLKFFPESMKGVPEDKWEIFPMDYEKERRSGINEKENLGPPKTEEEKKVEELQRIENDFAPTGLEHLALEEEIMKTKKIEELIYSAKDFPENSLERRAIEEEVARLKKQQ